MPARWRELSAPLTHVGIVHRDIKPANMMIGSSGQVKVLDFGIARHTLLQSNAETQQFTAATLSAPGTFVGTVGYVSPEQLEGRPADARSDVFALGSVMFEMLTGTRAFVGNSAWAIANQTLYHDPPALESCRSDVPARLAKIVSRCLAKDSANRYPSAGELYEELLCITRRAYCRVVTREVSLCAIGSRDWDVARASGRRNPGVVAFSRVETSISACGYPEKSAVSQPREISSQRTGWRKARLKRRPKIHKSRMLGTV